MVLLACFDRYTYEAGEWFTADLRVANYGRQTLAGPLCWRIAEGRTILGQGRQQGAATACLVLAGQQYVLRQGANTVGRKAQTSQATLQLPVSDPYMSRHHLQITVSVLPNGKLKAVISNDRNKNITSINGVELPHDEAIVLSNGDRIVMGKTTVVYQER